jgi:hypothetical protein
MFRRSGIPASGAQLLITTTVAVGIKLRETDYYCSSSPHVALASNPPPLKEDCSFLNGMLTVVGQADRKPKLPYQKAALRQTELTLEDADLKAPFSVLVFLSVAGGSGGCHHESQIPSQSPRAVRLATVGAPQAGGETLR